MTGSDLDALLARWFVAAAWPAAERARLHAGCVAFLADPARVAGQAALFAPEARVAWGLAWWEERQRGASERIPPDDEARLLMALTIDTRLAPRPPARPHCPAAFVGRWRLADAPAPRHRDLAADGSVLDEAGETRCWRVHHAVDDVLYLGSGADPLHQPFTVARLDASTLELVPPGWTRGQERWVRA